MNIKTKVIVGYIIIIGIIIAVNVAAVITIQTITLKNAQISIYDSIVSEPTAQTAINATKFNNYRPKGATVCTIPNTETEQSTLPSVTPVVPKKFETPNIEGRNFSVNLIENFGIRLNFTANIPIDSSCYLEFYPDNDQVTSFRNTVIKVFLIIDSVIFIIGLYVLYYAILKIIRPINLINNSLQSLQNYNFDDEVKITNHDELGEIQNNIRLVRDNLKAYIDNQHSLTQALIHETKSPITTINSAAYLFKEGVPPYSDSDYFFNVLSENMQKIEETSQFALEIFDSNQISNIEKVNVKEMIESLLNDWDANFVKRNIKIEVLMVSIEYTINRELFKVILNNFFQNIYYHASENSTVSIMLDAENLTIRNKTSKTENSQTQKGVYLTKKILKLYNYRCEYTTTDDYFTVKVHAIKL